MTNINEKIRTTWNLSLLFTSDNDPKMISEREKLLQAVDNFVDKWKNRTDFLKDPNILKEALDDYENWRRNCGAGGKEWYYFWLRSQLDENDPEMKARFNQINDLAIKVQNKIQFFPLRLAKINKIDRELFLNSPLLLDYRHYLERIFAESDHLLSEEEEKIANLFDKTSYENWVKMISGFISKESRKVLTPEGIKQTKYFSEISNLIDNKNKAVRDSAADALNNILRQNAETAEIELNSVMEYKKTSDWLRKYSRPDQSRLISDDLENEVVDSLIAAVSSRFDLSKRYYQLKAKLLGLPKLEYHERNIEYGELDIRYNFDDAVKLTRQVFQKLDPEFSQIFDRMIRSGQVDVFPKKSKQFGAFCISNLLTQPTYILLNFTEKLRDVSTLAHEFGHAINDELVKKSQNALNGDVSTATAEVASTFFEDSILEELRQQAGPETVLALSMLKLNDDVSAIFRQIALYKFEQELHQTFRTKSYLSKEEIGGIFSKHMASYMGEAVLQSTGSENWWIHWHHIRMFFYTYSYASGLLISKALQNKVRNDHTFINNVKTFLSAGQSKSPVQIFIDLGLNIKDPTFWNQGLNEIEKLLNKTEELADKLAKS